MTPAVNQLVVGPPRHGVVRFGLALHAALRQQGRDVAMLRVDDVAGLPRCLGERGRLVHLQFTDRLFGGTPGTAARTVAALADRVRDRGSALTATLHDLPQPSDGTHFAARLEAYRLIVARCDRVVVSSDHEAELLREHNVSADDVTVIPLPIASPDGRSQPDRAGPITVGLFGFLYPGKGHEDVINAAAAISPEVEICALGAPSAGHENMVADLHRAAAQQHRVFRVTGHISEDRLKPALRAVTVPVVAHRHISASGSLNTWLSAGRRPLAPQNRYTVEAVRRNPGCLALYADSPAGLRAALRHAVRHPAGTWLPVGTVVQPSPSTAATAYADMFRIMLR